MSALLVGLILFIAWRTSFGVPRITRAVLDRDIVEVKKLLDDGTDPNTTVAYYFIEFAGAFREPGSTPLPEKIAAVFGLGPPAPSLLEIASSSLWGPTNWEMIELLVDHPTIDAKSSGAWIAMLRALSEHRFDVADRLLAKGFPLNRSERPLSSPLQTCAAGNLAGCKFLLERGATVDVLYQRATQPMMDGTGAVETVDEAGFKPPEKDAGEIYRMLIEHGLPVHLRFSGAAYPTLLHAAVELNDAGLAELLIAQGFDLSTKEYRGQTALEVAKEKSLAVMVAILERAASRMNQP